MGQSLPDRRQDSHHHQQCEAGRPGSDGSCLLLDEMICRDGRLTAAHTTQHLTWLSRGSLQDGLQGLTWTLRVKSKSSSCLPVVTYLDPAAYKSDSVFYGESEELVQSTQHPGGGLSVWVTQSQPSACLHSATGELGGTFTSGESVACDAHDTVEDNGDVELIESVGSFGGVDDNSRLAMYHHLVGKEDVQMWQDVCCDGAGSGYSQHSDSRSPLSSVQGSVESSLGSQKPYFADDEVTLDNIFEVSTCLILVINPLRYFLQII